MGVPIPSYTILTLMYCTRYPACARGLSRTRTRLYHRAFPSLARTHTSIFVCVHVRSRAAGTSAATGSRGRAVPMLLDADRSPRSRLSRSSPDATSSQYRVSPPAELVSDLCQSRASRRLSLPFFLSLSPLSFSLSLSLPPSSPPVVPSHTYIQTLSFSLCLSFARNP